MRGARKEAQAHGLKSGARGPTIGQSIPVKNNEAKEGIMSEESVGNPPRSFWLISIVALLWNLLGVMAYLMQVTISEEALAAMPEAERMLYENIPAWAMAAFAIAVFAGALGSLLLLLRKGVAVPVFVLSLAAIVVQMFHNLFIADTVEVMGTPAVAFPLIVIVIAVFLAWYSQTARRKGWLR
jgi:hypothetical protein